MIQNPQDKKILLIEDEYYISDLYERVLENAGFQVEVAGDGEKGLTLAQNQPNLILLDIMLPKLNGIEVLKRLKADENLKNIPVVSLTNLSQSEIIREAFNLGAAGYLLKVDLQPPELVEQVNKFLEDPSYKMDFDSLDV